MTSSQLQQRCRMQLLKFDDMYVWMRKEPPLFSNTSHDMVKLTCNASMSAYCNFHFQHFALLKNQRTKRHKIRWTNSIIFKRITQLALVGPNFVCSNTNLRLKNNTGRNIYCNYARNVYYNYDINFRKMYQWRFFPSAEQTLSRHKNIIIISKTYR